MQSIPVKLCIHSSSSEQGKLKVMKLMKIIFFTLFTSIFIFFLYWCINTPPHSTKEYSGTAATIRTISQELKANLKTLNINPEEKQIARKQHLKEYCHKHTFNKSPRPEEFLQLAVDDELKLIYCVIPKVGTKTWKRVLVQSRGLQPGIHRWDAWKRLSSYTAKERKQRLETYFKFVFVREPLGRLLSAYKDRLIKHSSTTRKERRNIVKAYRPQEFKPNGKKFVSFREFIQYYSDNKTRNQHWRQYEKLCHPCIIDYNFIGHLETLEEDAPLLLKMAGIDGRVTFPPVHNSTGSSEVIKYFSQVPSEYITRIGELYRSDFEMFGYEYLGAVTSLLKRA